ncbi:MAG: TonB-dependent receptor [Gemmatimonadaceae bacterium]
MRTIEIAGALCVLACSLQAQDTAQVRRDSAAKLGTVKVTAERSEALKGKPMQSMTLPVSASITARKAEQTINVVDAEDAVKYLPSVFLRKRNNGDTQAVMGTRVWGVSSSARSLVFADGVPLSALIANNNNIGGPRWGLVSPAEIQRIDMMYGPFSAAYAGNSMGAVMEITTRMPDSLTASISQTQALQHFDLYGTRDTYGTRQTTGDVGNRFGKFSVLASGSYQDSHSQPLGYVTSTAFPAGTTGGYAESNKLARPANVLGATGLLHTQMTNAKVKLAYDITPAIRASYVFGLWMNDGTSAVDSYVSGAAGPTYAGQAAFASGNYDVAQRHTSHSVSVRSDLKGMWDFEAVAARYSFDEDQQRLPLTASSSEASFGTAGRIAVLDGTSWQSLDLKGAFRHGGIRGLPEHTFTFGAHLDGYVLENPTFNTTDWKGGSPGTVATEGDGRTRTQALWLQESWRPLDRVTVTAGGRYERWRAYDGFNASGTTNVVQPEVSAGKFSPKLVVQWTPDLDWTITGSVAKAYRFATAAELYQLVSTGATFTSPDPNLKPDDVLATEVRAARQFEKGTVQLSLFQDDVHDAIISQFLPLVANSTTLYSYLSNVDHVRARGAEVSFGFTDALVRGFEVSGSATYLDARTLALSGRASATAPAGSAIGAQLPNIPKWRANFVTTYKRDEHVAFTFAGRYSSLLYTTLDNADLNPNTYQGFAPWFVADARVTYRIDRHWTTSLGADNLFDRKYFLFHPFPQRTFVGSARYSL